MNKIIETLAVALLDLMFVLAMFLEIRNAQKRGSYETEKERMSLCKIVGVAFLLMAVQEISKVIFLN